MRIRRLNYYGLRHDKIAKKFKGGSEYLGDYPIRKENSLTPSAIYASPKYDASLGHKPFFYLTQINGSWYIGGLTYDEASKLLTRIPGLWCRTCGVVVYSCHRHHYATCRCGGAAIDGGRDYQRYCIMPGADVVKVDIDLLNRKIKYRKIPSQS